MSDAAEVEVKLSKEERKRLKAEKKERKAQQVNAGDQKPAVEAETLPPAEATTRKGETKEERKARRAAEYAAKAVADAQASSSKIPLSASKSEIEVDKLLATVTPKHEKSETAGETEEDRKARKKEKKERKRLEAEAAAQAAETSTAAVENEVKKEKRKRSAEDETATSSGLAVKKVTPAGEEAPKKKKKAKKEKAIEGIPTAEEIYADEALSDSAKKAIQYAQQYAVAHSGSADEDQVKLWKFNKARQIWLVRHFWDDEEIPDKYVDVVMGYLKTVQGMGRSGLIETAKKKRDAQVQPVEPEVVEADTAPAETSAVEKAESAPETKEAATEGADTPAETPASDAESLRKLETGKARAEKILKAMGAR